MCHHSEKRSLHNKLVHRVSTAHDPLTLTFPSHFCRHDGTYKQPSASDDFDEAKTCIGCAKAKVRPLCFFGDRAVSREGANPKMPGVFPQNDPKPFFLSLSTTI